MDMDIQKSYQNYFNMFHELGRDHTWKENGLAILKIASLLTGVVPLGFAVAWYLDRRITPQNPPSPQAQKVGLYNPMLQAKSRNELREQQKGQQAKAGDLVKKFYQQMSKEQLRDGVDGGSDFGRLAPEGWDASASWGQLRNLIAALEKFAETGSWNGTIMVTDEQGNRTRMSISRFLTSMKPEEETSKYGSASDIINEIREFFRTSNAYRMPSQGQIKRAVTKSADQPPPPP